MDFSKVLIRCSSLGCLFTDPKSVEDKKSGELSATAKAHLISVYSELHWGRRKEVSTKQMKKGTDCEDDGIDLLSFVDGKEYKKSDESKSNDYISGHIDIDNEEEDEIIDTKLSYEAETFLPKICDKVDKDYIIQLQGYMWLWNRSKARLVYCLVNAKQDMIEQEKYYLLRRMNVVSEESPEYIEAAAGLEYNMIFDDIDPHERIISIPVYRDENIISQIPSKVEKAREFLQQFHQKHLSLNKKLLINL